MSKEKPEWLPATREFCKSAGIEVCGWGSDTLLVRAESENHAVQAAAKLRPLGFEPVQNEDDSDAGLLMLSRDPVATRSRQDEYIASSDVSMRPKSQRAAALFEIAFVVFVAYGLWHGITVLKFLVLLGLAALLMWDASRILLWKLEMNSQELRVRRSFQWETVPWSQVRSIEVCPTWGRGQEAVRLTLTSKAVLNLGAFGFVFARLLRDRLRSELKQRQGQPG